MLAAVNASQTDTRPFLSMSAPGSVRARMKYSGNMVSNRCATESVAVMTTRRGRLEQGGPFRGREVGADQVELGFDAVERTVANEQDDQQIVSGHVRAQATQRALH